MRIKSLRARLKYGDYVFIKSIRHIEEISSTYFISNSMKKFIRVNQYNPVIARSIFRDEVKVQSRDGYYCWLPWVVFR